MTTIASMIESRLRQIEAEYQAPQDRATGGAVHDPIEVAREKERRLWDALEPDKAWVWTPEGHKTLREITDLASGLKAEMRTERAANGVTPAFKQMRQLDRTMENMIKVAASRASDREAKAARRQSSLPGPSRSSGASPAAPKTSSRSQG